MNRVLKIKQTNEQRVYVTSDTHLNHDPSWEIPIWEARGYDSADHHTDSIIETINDIVRPEDILFHLGDICLNTSDWELEELLARIRCQNIYLVWGNHNNPIWRLYKDKVNEWFKNITQGYVSVEPDLEVYPFRYKNVLFLGNYVEATIDGQYYVMEHYPLYIFNYMKDGAKMLCGHSHCGLEFSKSTNPVGKILDVGWDEFKRPLSMEEISDIMNTKSVFIPGDHHKRIRD